MKSGGIGGDKTITGALFEARTKGEAPGIPFHKKDLGKFYKKQTGKYYALSQIRPNKAKGIPENKTERAKMFEGQYLFSHALEPDECYIDFELSRMTVFEKKYQTTGGSVDEKLQTCDFKLQQYKKIAYELEIKDVYYIYILSQHFNNPYYMDSLNYINSIPNCSYYFVD